MTTFVFLDTETTGLDPERHEVWEVGCVVRDHLHPHLNGEWLWQLGVDLTKADPTGLRIGRYYERRRGEGAVLLAAPNETSETPLSVSPQTVALSLAVLLDGAHMVGAVPSFDAAFLARFLRQNGQCPTWHYHLVDVEALAAGHAQTEPPWHSDDLSRWVGVEPDEAQRHTALGDARWAMAIFDAVMSGGGPKL